MSRPQVSFEFERWAFSGQCRSWPCNATQIVKQFRNVPLAAKSSSGAPIEHVFAENICLPQEALARPENFMPNTTAMT